MKPVLGPSLDSERERERAQKHSEFLRPRFETGTKPLLTRLIGQGDARDQPRVREGRMATLWLQKNWDMQLLLVLRCASASKGELITEKKGQE